MDMEFVPRPEATDFGYTGDMGWNKTVGFHRWKIAMCEWLIAFEEQEIAEHERKIRELGGESDTEQLFAW